MVIQVGLCGHLSQVTQPMAPSTLGGTFAGNAFGSNFLHSLCHYELSSGRCWVHCCFRNNRTISAAGMGAGGPQVSRAWKWAGRVCLGDLRVELNISERGGWGAQGLKGWGAVMISVFVKALLGS